MAHGRIKQTNINNSITRELTILCKGKMFLDKSIPIQPLPKKLRKPQLRNV